MPIISLNGARFCKSSLVEKELIDNFSFDPVNQDVINQVAKKYAIPSEKLLHTLQGHVSLFNNFTKEREKHLQYLKTELGAFLEKDNILISGALSWLVPLYIPHILKIYCTAPLQARITRALESKNHASEKDAIRSIKEQDLADLKWSEFIHNAEPWDKNLYDIVIPTHQTDLQKIMSLISDNLNKSVVKISEPSRVRVSHFNTVNQVNQCLMDAGHFDAEAKMSESTIVISINRQVMMLESLSKELMDIATPIAGDLPIKIKVNPIHGRADIYRKQNFELPKKILLVDDEENFVCTLSERLQMRDFGTAVAYSGEEALSMAKDDMPEVMLLDLRMPGINGLQVLERLKKESPEVEVIVLTGHGSDQDREQAMKLGAFAYLEKPADIESISQTMKDAYAKIKASNSKSQS